MPRIFAIGDLHLSLSVENKAMDVFGPGWANHVARLQEGWQDTVTEEDLVLLPGDISWGLRLEEAQADLDFIHRLKGTKILLQGQRRAAALDQGGAEQRLGVGRRGHRRHPRLEHPHERRFLRKQG